MQNIEALFGESPYKFIVTHARKVRECIDLVRPVAEAAMSGDLVRAVELQRQVSGHEYEADQARSAARKRISRRLMLSAEREDMRELIRQMDRMGDDAEAFALGVTYRALRMSDMLHPPFDALVNKVVQACEGALSYVEQLETLARESFSGPESRRVAEHIEEIGYLEWESDQLGHAFRRVLFSENTMDPVAILLLDKMTASLLGIADHADNVAHSLRLMIKRR
ncbi:MAG: DUF47 family protein [Kiritimatiellae bacterium]|nr:DUF47 family protein [Kiritimatiellia bacterium]